MSEDPPAPDATAPKSRSATKVALPILAIIAILAAVTVTLALGNNNPTLVGNAVSSKTAGLDGLKLTPAIAAPPLDTLRNYNGASFNLAADRGKAVFVTFLYVHCPDVCPLIASHLHTAYVTMPQALRSRVAIVAVSVDPHGDSPGEVAAFMREHQLNGEADYLIGAANQLAPVWKAWYVGSTRDTSRPDLVNHSALIYGVSSSGKLITVYAANSQPKQLVHDAPALLAR